MGIKPSELETPPEATDPLDDWVIDVTRFARKKVALFTHAKTLYSFLIPYGDAGSAKKLPRFFEHVLGQFLLKQPNHEKHLTALCKIYDTAYRYCKTDSRPIQGHMKDFIFCMCAERFSNTPFELINFSKIEEDTNTMPINVRGIGYTQAGDRMESLLTSEPLRLY